MTPKLSITTLINWLSFLIFASIGVINLFWGNDPEFGVFIIILSFTYIPQVGLLFHKITGLRIHWIVKVLTGLFVLWAALGVGELFDKIDLMLTDFK